MLISNKYTVSVKKCHKQSMFYNNERVNSKGSYNNDITNIDAHNIMAHKYIKLARQN